MEYTVYAKNAPKSVSTTLCASNPMAALKEAAAVLQLPVSRLAVTDYAHYEDYVTGQITRDALVLASLHARK